MEPAFGRSSVQTLELCAGQRSRLGKHAMSTACRVMQFQLGNRRWGRMKEGLGKQAIGGEFDRLLHIGQFIKSAAPSTMISHFHPSKRESPALGPHQPFTLPLEVLIIAAQRLNDQGRGKKSFSLVILISYRANTKWPVTFTKKKKNSLKLPAG